MSDGSWAEIGFVGGGAIEVEGTIEEVERSLSDAARSGASRLAWFNERAREAPVGINPANVVTLRRGEIRDL